MKEDVKKKDFSLPLGEMQVWRFAASPVSFLEGMLVLRLLHTARCRGSTHPSCLSQLDGFMSSGARRHAGSDATQAKRWRKLPTIILCETRGL
jgi:hypothetical protein